MTNDIQTLSEWLANKRPLFTGTTASVPTIARAPVLLHPTHTGTENYTRRYASWANGVLQVTERAES